VPLYKKWVKARDRALEQLHTRAQLESADIVRKMLTNTLQIAKSLFDQMKSGDMSAADHLDHQLKPVFIDATQSLYMIMITLRRQAYVLSKASEAEIIAQLMKAPVKAIVTHQDIHRIQGAESVAGGQVLHRLKLYLDKLRRRIVNQAQSSAMNDSTVNDFMINVMQAFPKPRVVRRPKRILKPQLMEADDPTDLNVSQLSEDPPADVALDFIDDQAWQDMLEYYKEDYVPQWRAPEYLVDLPTSDEETWYAWEFERDLVNEFVQSVRDGQIEAANENGITDFVWIAVVDNVTDACCLWRDGLLVSEIEQSLDDHQDEDDECNAEGDGLTPPLHFNCRCTLAPATDEIPEKPDTQGNEFDDWLMS